MRPLFSNKPESLRGRELLLQRFHPDNPAIETLIIRSETATVDDPAFQAAVQEIVRRLTERPYLVDAVITYYHLNKALGHPTAESMVSPDRHAMLVRVQMAGTIEQLSSHAEEYEALVRELARPGFQVLSLGSITVHHEFNQVAESDLRRGEAIGLPIALLVLVIVFGALVAAGVPVILSIVSIVIALGLTAIIGRFVDLSLYVVNMITMIGLAIGIDYALFIISRYREERSKGLPVVDAVENAGATAGKAVLFSGMTVVLTLAGLLFLPTTVFQSLGAGAVVVVLVAMAAMLTLVPALLGLLGDRIDWPRLRGARALGRAAQPRQGVAPTGIGIWWCITHLIMARPLLSAAAAGLVLVGLALPSLDLQRGSADNLSTLPEGKVKHAYQALARDFSTGLLDPIEIAIDGQRTPQSEVAIAALVERIRQTPLFTPAVEVQWTTAGDLAVVRVPLAVEPASPEAIQGVRTLRGELISGAALIMIVVFAGFASGRLIVFQQLGFGLAVAVLLDATVIRTVLVLATMAVLGRFNWYLPT